MSEQDVEAGNVGVTSPGAQLRAAREARELTLAAVAGELRLDVPVLTSLEKDDYQALPGSVFVRGYLRSYGKLLGLDTQALLDAYHQLCPQEHQPSYRSEPAVAIGTSTSTSRQGWLFPLLALLALAGLAAGAFFLLEQPQDMGTATEEAGESPALPPLLPPLNQVSETQPSTSTAQTEPSGVEVPAPHAAAPVSEFPADSTSGVEAAAEDAVTLSEAASSIDTQDGMSSGLAPEEPASDIEEAAAAMLPQPVDSPVLEGNMRVRLEFSEESWTDVRAVDGQRLLFGLQSAGAVEEFEATPPVSFTLGNSAAVQVFVNGRIYPHAEHNRGNVARFSLTEAELGE